MWALLSLINIIGSAIAIMSVMFTISNYHMAPRMKTYGLLRCVGLVMMAFVQLYSITDGGFWLLKIGSMYWWLMMLFWNHIIKYSSIKK